MSNPNLKFKRVSSLPAASTSNQGTVYFNTSNKTINVCTGSSYETYSPATYAGSSTAGGSATSAVKLDTSSAGSSNLPVYFSGGKPTSISSLTSNYLSYSVGPTVGLVELATIDTTQGDRLAFLPADQIIVEKTTDGGTTWVSAGMTDSQKEAIFSSKDSGGSCLNIPLNSSGVKSCQCAIRITMTGMKYNVPSGTAETDKINYWNSTYVKSTERYWGGASFLNYWVSGNSDYICCTLEIRTGSSSTWRTVRTVNKLTGWSGRDTMATSNDVFGGGTNQTGNYWNWRLTFRTQASDGSFDDSKLSTSYTTSSQGIYSIRAYSASCWTNPNNMMSNGHIYSWDTSQNASFPAKVTATSIVKSGGTSSQFLNADGSVTTLASGMQVNSSGQLEDVWIDW